VSGASFLGFSCSKCHSLVLAVAASLGKYSLKVDSSQEERAALCVKPLIAAVHVVVGAGSASAKALTWHQKTCVTTLHVMCLPQACDCWGMGVGARGTKPKLAPTNEVGI
jgi:hypothetical protein